MKKLLILAMIGAGVLAHAQGPAVVSWTGGSRFPVFYGGSTVAAPDMVGFQFQVNTAMDTNQFGIWNDNDANGLDHTHRVMLWRLGDGALLADVTVNPSSTLINGFRYETGPNISLVTGQTYVLAADYWSGGLDGYISTPTSVTYDPSIIHVGASHPAAASLGYVMPTLVTTTNRGRFGPNIILSNPIPEPTTMVALGLGGLALLRRKRKS